MVTKRRNKGEGSITQLPNGKYKMTITLGKDIYGKQKRKSVTASTKKELFDKALQLKAKYNLLTPEELKVQMNDVSFKEFVNKLTALKENSLTKNSCTTYKALDKNYLFPTLGHLQIKNITPDICESLLFGLIHNKELSPTTVRSVRARLSNIFTEAIKRNIILVNPLTRISISTPKSKRKATMTLPSVEEIKYMLEYCKEHKPHLYPIIYTALFTGMRIGELRGLKWDAVDLKKKIITVRNQIVYGVGDAPLKTESSYRTIYISDKVIQVLKDLPHKSPYVFTSPVSGSYYSRGLSDIVKNEVFLKSGLPDNFTFHDLRHFHATQLIKNNVNVKVVSRRLGHKDINTTLDLYFNFMPSMDEDASKVMDDILH